MSEDSNKRSERPPVFRNLSFEEATTLAKKESRIVLVDATAHWCQPCALMDRSTWRNQEVVEWLQQHCIPIQIDIDAYQDLARQLAIKAMPTIIAIGPLGELDRVVGAQSSAELLEWLNLVRDGKRRSQFLHEQQVQNESEGGRIDLHNRLELARTLANSGQFEESTKAYHWLWTNMLHYDVAYIGVRFSYMVSEMKSLAEGFEPAREAYSKLRDELESRLSESNQSNLILADWMALNRIVGNERRTLLWFEVEPNRDSLLDKSLTARQLLEKLLIDSGRWSDVAVLYPMPLDILHRHLWMVTLPEDLEDPDDSDEEREEYRQVHLRMFRSLASRMYAALLAANRTNEASEIMIQSRTIDPSEEMLLALVESATNAKQARPEHLACLDVGNSKDSAKVARLRHRVQSQLRQEE
jgi:thioredoxin 1